MKYQPIDCEFHDTLEEACVRKLKVKFNFTDDSGTTKTYVGLLRDFKTKDGEEFVLLDDGTWLRLDKMVSLERVP